MRATFGSIRKLPSGRYQARYTNRKGERIPAPQTFINYESAQRWLDQKLADDPPVHRECPTCTCRFG